MVKFKDLEDIAIEMVGIYKDHSNTVTVGIPDGSCVKESYVTDEGMDRLAKHFNGVDINARPGVYSIFIDKLREADLGADIEQFKGAVH